METRFQTGLQRTRLGHAVNLLHGLDAFPIGPGSLTGAPSAPLEQFPVEIQPSPKGGWQPPGVSIYPGAEALVEHLWGCHVNPHRFEKSGFEVCPARLVRSEPDRADRRRGMEEFLGLQLAEERTYLLFELRRTDGRADHEVTAQPALAYFDLKRHLAPKWRRATSRLRPGTRIHDGFEHDAIITAEMAQCYIDCMYEFGTHFISAVDVGDVLFQVAALQPGLSARIVAHWRQAGNGKPVSGAEAIAFGAFLGPSCAMEVGRVVSMAGDPALPASMACGAWSDPSCLGGASLLGVLRPGRDEARAMLTAFNATAAIQVELTSLSRFMEYYRSINFERVLRGALMQRWGQRVHLPLRRMPQVERAIAAMVLDGELPAMSAGDLASIVEPGAVPDRSYPANCEEQHVHVAGCHRVLSLRAHRTYHKSGPVLAQFLDAAPISHYASVLRLRENEFERPGAVCEKMAGALILEDESGSRRDAVVDGLRFTDGMPAPDTGWPRVQMRGDIHSIEAGYLDEALAPVRLALESVSPALSSACGDERRRADAASFAAWLAGLMAPHANRPDLQRLRVLGLYLSRVEGGLPMEHEVVRGVRARSDAAKNDRMHGHFEAIASCAIEADERMRDHEAHARARMRSHSDHAPESFYVAQFENLRRLKLLRRSATEHYLALLAELDPGFDEEVQRAARLHCDSAAAVLDLATAFAARAAENKRNHSGFTPADYVVLHALAAANLQASTEIDISPLLGRREERAARVALEFAAREESVREFAALLQAIEAFCDEHMDESRATGAIERALDALAGAVDLTRQLPAFAIADLRAALTCGLSGESRLRSLAEALTAAWKRFEATRAALMACRSDRCRVRMQTWFHSMLAADDLAADPFRGAVELADDAVKIERFRLLAVLGQTLRWQREMLTAAGLAMPQAAGIFEPGAMGYLTALQTRLLIDGSAEPQLLAHDRSGA